MQGTDNAVSNGRFDLCSYGNPGGYNAVEVLGTGINPDGSFGPGRGLRLDGIETSGGDHGIGVLIKPGVGNAYGTAAGLLTNGRTARYQNQCASTFAISSVLDPADPRNTFAIAPDGPARVSKGDWTAPLIIGNRRIWEADGKLWTKNGTPTSSGDGQLLANA